MSLISFLKGVFRKMTTPKAISDVLHISPAVSSIMKDSIELWESMYSNQAPWIDENVHSLGIPAMIASEKSRLATLEMEYKITGDSPRAEFIRTHFKKVVDAIRTELEYGIALGGLVIKPYVKLGANNKYVIDFNFTKANNFYPLSFSQEGVVTEAAFLDKITRSDKVYIKLEHHKLVGTTLVVKNMAFLRDTSNELSVPVVGETLGEPISLSTVPEWAELVPEVVIDNMDRTLFDYFKMPLANNVDLNSPLGVSGFSRAAGLIKDADEQYGNLLWEFYGSQLAVDVDRTAINPLLDKDGKQKYMLPKLQDRLFRRSLDLGDDNTYNVFSPTIRDASLINGLNNILMHIEDCCDLSRGTLSTITYSEARTATELKILKQRSFAANADIQKELERSLRATIDIMCKYCDLYEIVPEGEFEVAFKWDDSIIVDKDAERQVDLLDVQAGLMSKVEYRMKWFGETKEQAKLALGDIKLEVEEQLKLQQVFSNKPSDEQTQYERASQSGKVVNNQENNS